MFCSSKCMFIPFIPSKYVIFQESVTENHIDLNNNFVRAVNKWFLLIYNSPKYVGGITGINRHFEEQNNI